MKQVVSGIFDYRGTKSGWMDSFRVVDDDGMPLVLDGLREFQGKPVIITVETRKS